MKRKTSIKKKEARLRIDHQEIIGEIQTKSYEIVRLSKVRYRGNPHDFIDIRLNRRGFDEAGEEIYFPTTKGVQLKKNLFVKLVEQYFIESLEAAARK